MRFLVGGLVALSLLFATARPGMTTLNTGCSPAPAGCGNLGAVRASCDATCCVAGNDHAHYVSCVDNCLKANVKLGNIPDKCRTAGHCCADHSTCGTNKVTCCRTDSKGNTTCSIKGKATDCKPPSHGSSCVGTHRSCCDACKMGGCASPSGAFVTDPEPALF